MHELALEQRRELGVRAPWHVGDITWGLRQHEGREDEWTIRIWQDGDRILAWSWLKGDRGLLEFDIRRDRLDLLDEILADPDARTAVAFEDDEDVQAALRRNGFTAHAEAQVTRHGSLMHFLARDLAEAPEPPVLPEGFRYRTVTPGDFAERVAIHREVWAPSRVTESSFANVQASWPYRASLDCVVEASGRPLRGVLPSLAGRRERRRRVRAGRRARGVQARRPRRRGLHVRAPPLARGGRAAGDRLLRERGGVRAVRVDRLPPAHHGGRLLALILEEVVEHGLELPSTWRLSAPPSAPPCPPGATAASPSSAASARPTVRRSSARRCARAARPSGAAGRGRGRRRPRGAGCRCSARVVSETRIWPPWPAAEIRAARTTSRPR